MRRLPLPLLAAGAAGLLLTACSGGQISLPLLHVSLHLPGYAPPAQRGFAATTFPTPLSGPTPPSTPELTIQQFVPIAERFVETHRGHPFKSPVPVTLLDDTAFRQKLLGDSGSDSAQITVTSKELKALHLIDHTVDLKTATDNLLGAGVSGFYDPKSKSLVVRGVAATPYVRQVLVHELTHALQDQYFGIDRPSLAKADDEQAAAFQALVEGDAVRIENEYHAAMTDAEQSEANREEAAEGAGIPGDTPRVLLEAISFPYVAGPRFVGALATSGGNAAVDRAFAHPPVSSKQLLDANTYLAGIAPRTLAVPHADGTAFDHGVNGEFGLILLFEQAGLDAAQARGAADLWGGDEYVAWNHGSGACVRMAVVAGTAAEQGDLDTALSAYAQSVGGTFAASTGGAPSVVTVCG